jgi:hypothetical protein
MAPNNKYPMNDEEFKRKLSLVAEWRLPEIKLDGVTRRKLRGRKNNETKYQDEHEQVFFKIYGGINPTATPEVTKVTRSACVCDDCGRDCPNGRDKEKKLYETNKKKHWRERCLTCKLSLNPKTGKFDLSNHSAAVEWNYWLRQEKNIKPKKPTKTDVIAEKTVEENHAEIIQKSTDYRVTE